MVWVGIEPWSATLEVDVFATRQRRWCSTASPTELFQPHTRSQTTGHLLQFCPIYRVLKGVGGEGGGGGGRSEFGQTTSQWFTSSSVLWRTCSFHQLSSDWSFHLTKMKKTISLFPHLTLIVQANKSNNNKSTTENYLGKHTQYISSSMLLIWVIQWNRFNTSLLHAMFINWVSHGNTYNTINSSILVTCHMGKRTQHISSSMFIIWVTKTAHRSPVHLPSHHSHCHRRTGTAARCSDRWTGNASHPLGTTVGLLLHRTVSHEVCCLKHMWNYTVIKNMKTDMLS